MSKKAKRSASSAIATEVRCPKCGVELGAETLAQESGFPCCRKCSAVFVWPDDHPPEGSPFKTSLGEPRGLEIVRSTSETGTEEVAVSWRYERNRTPQMAALALALIGGVVALFVYWSRSGHPIWPWFAAFPLVVFGCTLSYTVVLTLAQWQRLEVKGGKLAIRSVPLPIPGAKAEFDASAVSDLYVKLRLEPAGPKKKGSDEPPPVYAFYDVRILFEGMDMPIGAFLDVERALHVATELRAALGLE